MDPSLMEHKTKSVARLPGCWTSCFGDFARCCSDIAAVAVGDLLEEALLAYASQVLESVRVDMALFVQVLATLTS